MAEDIILGPEDQRYAKTLRDIKAILGERFPRYLVITEVHNGSVMTASNDAVWSVHAMAAVAEEVNKRYKNKLDGQTNLGDNLK